MNWIESPFDASLDFIFNESLLCKILLTPTLLCSDFTGDIDVNRVINWRANPITRIVSLLAIPVLVSLTFIYVIILMFLVLFIGSILYGPCHLLWLGLLKLYDYVVHDCKEREPKDGDEEE